MFNQTYFLKHKELHAVHDIQIVQPDLFYHLKFADSNSDM